MNFYKNKMFRTDFFKKDVFWIIVFSALLTAFFFHDIVFTDKIFADRDMLLVYLPMFKYWAERVLSGGFPDWYPYDALWEPFIGNVLGSAFHPLKLLFLIFASGTALKISTLFCYPLAYVGLYLLMRSLRAEAKAAHIGAILFAFNGYAVSMTNNFPYLLGMASTPWAFWLTVRLMQSPGFGRAFLSALGYALILFSGETQSFILACLGGAFIPWVIPDCQGRRRKCFLSYCGTMALAAALSAVQWVPSLQMMRDAAPGASGGNDAMALTWSMPFLRLPELFFGGLSGSEWYSESYFARFIYSYKLKALWTKSVYFGIPGLIFAIIAFRKKEKTRIFLGSASFLILICILGDNVGLYSLLHKIPFFTPLRYPEKLFSIWMLAMSMLASFGFSDALHELQNNFFHNKKIWKFFFVGFIISSVCLLLETGFGVWSKQIIQRYFSDRASALTLKNFISDVAACTTLSLSCTNLCLIACGLFFWHHKKILYSIVFVTFFVTMMFGSFGTLQPAIPELVSQAIPPLKMAQDIASQRRETPRVLSASNQLNMSLAVTNPELNNELYRINLLFLFSGNYPALFNIEMSRNYLPGSSRRYKNLMKSASASDGMEKIAPLFSNQLISIFGRDYANYGGRADRVIYEHPDLGALLVLVPDPMPKAYLSRPICVKTPEESLKGVLDSSFDFRNTSIIECGAGGRPAASVSDDADNSAELGQTKLIKRDPEYVTVEVDSIRDGNVLVLTDAYYSGWTATIDGSPVEILPANHAVRGVMVPQGKHIVEFKYRTPGLIPAAIVSLGTLILGVLTSFIFRWRRRKTCCVTT